MSVGAAGVTGPVPTAADPVGNIFGTIATNAPTGGTATDTSQPIFPGSSLSPYFLGQIGQSQIQLGAGIASGGTMSIDAAVNLLDSLPSNELLQIESMLWSAGFYTDANGNPLKTAPVLGTLDDQGRRAWINALIASFSSGTPVTTTLNNAIQSGQGAELRSTLPSAVMGGGNVYTIDLTQPGAVNQVANSIFQAALGRNANGAELANITNAVNTGAIQQGLAKEQGAEMSAQQQYQQRVNQRNIQYQFETTPKTALGAVPSGDIGNPAEYATSLLQYMGLPVNTSNVAFLIGWINAESNDPKTMNPLGSQNAVPGSQPTSSATPNYTSYAQSLQATAAALQSGPYTDIVAALQNGDASAEVSNKALQAALGKWSGGQYKDITQMVQAATQQAQGQVNVTQQQGQATGQAAQAQTPYQQMPGYEAFIKGGGTPEQWQQQIAQEQAQAQAGQGGTAQSTGAEGGGPGAGIPATPAGAVTPGQQQTNPGDIYVNPVTVESQNPLSPEQASYLEATTGPNRFGFAENNYLHAFLAAMSMIRAGGPTGA